MGWDGAEELIAIKKSSSGIVTSLFGSWNQRGTRITALSRIIKELPNQDWSKRETSPFTASSPSSFRPCFWHPRLPRLSYFVT